MDTFQTFPLHPQPELCESLSSYLLRLSVANRISFVYRLFRLVFPGEKHNTDFICDLVPTSWGILPQVSQCTEERLLQTTFHHLVNCFVPGKTAAVRRSFLGDTVVNHLRFCPVCLQTQGYYKLQWRFTCIPGCPEHNCYLHDACPHCDTAIPLFFTPLLMNTCPTCGQSLMSAEQQPLSAEDWAHTRIRFHDIGLLLSQPHDGIDLRSRLALLRQEAGYSRQEMCRLLNIRMVSLKGLEAVHKRPTPIFATFLDYLDVLSISFHDVLQKTPPIPDWQRSIDAFATQRREQLAMEADRREDKLAQRTVQALAQLQQDDENINVWALSSALSMNTADIRCYPRLSELLQHYDDLQERERFQRREADLLAQVEAAIQQLQGEPLTKQKICLYTKRRKGTIFQGYPRVWKHICEVVDADKKARRRVR